MKIPTKRKKITSEEDIKKICLTFSRKQMYSDICLVGKFPKSIFFFSSIYHDSTASLMIF